MGKTSNSFENVINKLDKYAILIIIAFLIIIGASPYIFTQNWTSINFSDTGNIGSTIGGITAPFIGILSALLVFLSFRAQINANRYQIQSIQDERDNRELENEITFLYHRLKEIKENGIKQQLSDSLKSLYRIIGEMNEIENLLMKKEGDESIKENLKNRFQKLESDNISQLLVLSRQVNLYIIVSEKLDEVKEKISVTQYEYMESSLRFEYLNSISTYFKYYDNGITKLENKGLLEKNLLVIRIKNSLTKVENRLNPSA